jgi:hypothetical protein
MRIVLSNKVAYTFIIIGVIVLIAISVNAYNSGGPPNVMGHTMDDEIEAPASCDAGEFLKWEGSPNNWECDAAQERVTGTCYGSVMVAIGADGSVTCEADDGGGGGVTSSATSHYIPKIDNPDSNNLVNSVIYEANGNIGIGTTGAGHKLEIYDTSVQDPGLDAHINLLGPSSRVMFIGRTGTYGYVQTHNNQPLALNPVGNNVGVGTDSPTEKLDVEGNIILSGVIKSSSSGNVIIQLG